MKHLLVWIGIGLAAVLTLASCGGGGGGGGDTAPAASIQISAVDNTTVAPLTRLTISGTGFNPSADLTVNFFDPDRFSFDIPVLEATTTSVTVAVPPYVNTATGHFEAGSVSVRVLQNSAGGTLTSNTIAGLEIDALPDLTLTPGDVSANVAAFMELSLTDTINRLTEIDHLPGSQVDTADLRAKLESIQLQYAQLKLKVRNAITDPDQAETVGTVNGVTITLDEESLMAADQLMVAMINGMLAQLQIASPASSQSTELSARSGMARSSVSSICDGNPQLCTASGQPLLTVKNYRTGEETAVGQYEYALALPEASEILGNMMNWFAAASATLGAVTVASGVTMPLIAVAAITQVNVDCMVAKYGLDAARLTADANDESAAKALLEDFNGTLAYMRDAVVSPMIAAMSEPAGVAYDLVMGWQPVMADQIPTFTSELVRLLRHA